jgi:hypothetical protein
MPFLAFKEIQVKQSTGNTEKEKKRRGSRIGYLFSYQASHNFKKKFSIYQGTGGGDGNTRCQNSFASARRSQS